VKKFVKNLKKKIAALPRLVMVAIVVVVALLAVGLFLIFRGGGGLGGIGSADRPVLTPGDLPEGAQGPRIKPPPRARTGVVDEARRIGRLAVAQARGVVVDPGRVRIRISAAPKQTVTVNWQLGCFRNRRVKLGRGEYRARTPDVRVIRVPLSGAETCTAVASAGLTKIKGEGRVKVAIIAG